MFETLIKYSETTLGKAVIGLVVTTIFGGWLSSWIQEGRIASDRAFGMYTVRLNEAKKLQQELLETLNTRLFELESDFLRMTNSGGEGDDEGREWTEQYKDARTKWHKNLIYWHSELDVLFDESLASKFVDQDEIRVIAKPKVTAILNNQTTQPETVHGAFVDAHATIEYMQHNCFSKANCADWDKLVLIARKQLEHLKSVSNCFAHDLSGRLLVDPYGPHSSYVLPKGCKSN